MLRRRGCYYGILEGHGYRSSKRVHIDMPLVRPRIAFPHFPVLDRSDPYAPDIHEDVLSMVGPLVAPQLRSTNLVESVSKVQWIPANRLAPDMFVLVHAG